MIKKIVHWLSKTPLASYAGFKSGGVVSSSDARKHRDKEALTKIKRTVK